MENKDIEWKEAGQVMRGKVALVYLEAIASGTSDYVSVTHMLVEGTDDKIYVIRPREVTRILNSN